MKTKDSQLSTERRQQRPRSKPAKSTNSAVDATLVIGAIRRWMLIAFPLGVLFAAAAGAAVLYLYEPEFKATAALLFKRESPYIAFETGKKSGNGNEAMTGEIEIMLSPLVFGPLLKSAEISQLPEVQLFDDPVSAMPKLLKIETKKGSELMKISFSGPNPKNTATIVNSVVKQYLIVRKGFREKESQQVIDLLEKEKEIRKTVVQEQSDRVRQLSMQLTGLDPFLEVNTGRRPLEDPTSDLKSRVTSNSYSQRILEKEIAALEESNKLDPPTPSEEEIQIVLEKDPAVVTSTRELQQAKEAYEQSDYYRSGFGPNQPAVRRLLARIKIKEEARAKLLEKVRPQIVRELANQLLTRNQQELESLTKQLKSLQIGEQFLTEELGKQEGATQVNSKDYFDLEIERKNLAKSEETLDQISARIFALRTEQAAPARVSELYPAAIPRKPQEVIPFKSIGLVAIVGLCLPFGLAVLWEIKVRRVTNSLQISENFETPIVAEVANLPRYAHSKKKRSRRMNRDMRVYEESVDSLRTNLLLGRREKKLQVIAVASSVSGEGKTSLATQLAISISKAMGKPTLLVDGDMRAPDIHHLFDIESQPGLADVLAGECELNDAVVKTLVDNLYVLPAGLLTNDPAFLLSNGSAAKFFEQVREEYAFVILDTPPILSANESMLLADAADGTLFCIMRDNSRFTQVSAAWQRINAAGGEVAGVVFNNVPSKTYAKTYGTYDYKLN